MAARKAGKKPPKKPGPEAETLAIEGDWEKAVKKAVDKKPPQPSVNPKRSG